MRLFWEVGDFMWFVHITLVSALRQAYATSRRANWYGGSLLFCSVLAIVF